MFVRSLSATLAAPNSRRLYIFACALHCHLLGVSPSIAPSLSPFLPAPHVCLPRLRKRVMLSLFHLKGRSFTCLDTQFRFPSVRLPDFHLFFPPPFLTVSSQRIARYSRKEDRSSLRCFKTVLAGFLRGAHWARLLNIEALVKGMTLALAHKLPLDTCFS